MIDTTIDTSVAPDISSSFLGITLNIGDYRSKQLDKKVTDSINLEHGVDTVQHKRVTGLYKELMGHCQELKTIHTHVQSVRSYFNRSTIPWGHSSMRVLSNIRYFGTNELDGVWNALEAMQSDFYTLKGTLLSVYEKMRDEEAPKVFGTLYNRADYLSLEDMDKRLYFAIETHRIAPMSHPMQGVEKERQKAVDDMMRESNSVLLKSAKRDMFIKLITPLQNMSERLGYSETDTGEMKKNGFKDTLTSNVQVILDLIKHDNFDGDPTLEHAYKTLTHALQGVTPDALREDEILRGDTKRQVDDVLSTLPTIGF